MKKLFVVMSSVLLMLGVGTSRSFASDPTVQELSLSTTTTTSGYIDSGDGVCPGPGCSYPPFSSELAAAGVSLSSYNTTSGLGTITYTISNQGGSGISSFFDIFIDEEVATPFDNEYVGESGTALPGEAWEAGDQAVSSLFSDFVAGTLGNVNYIPGNDSNLPDSLCGSGPDCNGDAGIALQEDIILPADYYETINVDVAAGTSCADSGVCLTQTNGTSGTSVSFSLNENTAQIPPSCQANANCVVNPSPTPEPSSWMLLATGLVGMGMIQVRRKNSAQGVL